MAGVVALAVLLTSLVHGSVEASSPASPDRQQSDADAEIVGCESFGRLTVTSGISLRAEVSNGSDDARNFFVRYTIVDGNRKRSALARSETLRLESSGKSDDFIVTEFGIGEGNNVRLFPGPMSVKCALYEDKLHIPWDPFDISGRLQTWSQSWLLSLPQDEQLHNIEFEVAVPDKEVPDEQLSVQLTACTVNDRVLLGESAEITGTVTSTGQARALNYRMDLWAYPNRMAEFADSSGRRSVHVGGGEYRSAVPQGGQKSTTNRSYIPKTTGSYTAECLLFGGATVHQEEGDPEARRALRILGLMLKAKDSLSLAPSIFDFLDTPIDLTEPKTLRDIEEERIGTLRGFRTAEFSVVPAVWKDGGIEISPSNQLDYRGGEVRARVYIREGKGIDAAAPSLGIRSLGNISKTAEECGITTDSATGIQERCWQVAFDIPPNSSLVSEVLYPVTVTRAFDVTGPVPTATLTVRARSQDAQDRATLVSVHRRTGGSRWDNRNNWGSEWLESTVFDDWDPWYGISLAGSDPNFTGTVEEGNRVVGLELPGNNLSGRIPSDINTLTELRTLDLHDNELSGKIPPQLGSLRALEYLDLSANDLTGAVPPEFGSLERLELLDLSNNELTGMIPEFLGGLTELEALDLSGNELEGEIPATLGRLTKLEALYLDSRDNELTGCIPSGLRNVRNNDLDDLGLVFCDVALSSLTVSPGELTTPFEVSRQSFTATVNHSRVTINPVAREGATFEVLGPGRREIQDANPAIAGLQFDLSPDDLGTDNDASITLRAISGDNEHSERYSIRLVADAGQGDIPSAVAAAPKGTELEVSWAAPFYIRPSEIESYNLRYIRSANADDVNGDWTEVEQVGQSGALLQRHRIESLSPRTEYDVQVQAVLSTGPGPWSGSATARTSTEIDVWSIGCYPSRTLVGRNVECSPYVQGGDPEDYSYVWTAPEGSTNRGTSRSLETSWDTPGRWTVGVRVCSAGKCDEITRGIRVEDHIPKLVWAYDRPPAEIPLGESIDLEFEITKLSIAGRPGGMSVSFPGLTARNTSGDASSYQSSQGTVETVGYSGRADQVVYYDRGGVAIENSDGNRVRPEHLLVATDNTRWPFSWFGQPSRTLRLKVTPREPGEFRILYRFWLCTDDRRNCARRPLQDGDNDRAYDQQGWASFEFVVNVVPEAVIEDIACTPNPAGVGDSVVCSPVISGGAPSSYAWNAGNALAGGSPFEGNDASFATSWDYPGRHRVSLEVCNVSGCADAEKFVRVRGDATAPEPSQLPGPLAADDGGRVLYSGPASGVAHSQYTTTDTVLLVKLLPTSPVPTLQATIYDEDGFGGGDGEFVSPGAIALALPRDAWVDHGGTATEMYLAGSWAPYTGETEAALLALQSILGAARQAASTVAGLAPAVGTVPGPALTASDHLALGLGGAAEPPVDDIFRETYANCVSQVVLPWLAWAGQTQAVRVSVPLSMPADAYASLAAAFIAAQPGDSDGEPALLQLHDLLDTGGSAPECQPPDPPTD